MKTSATGRPGTRAEQPTTTRTSREARSAAAPRSSRTVPSSAARSAGSGGTGRSGGRGHGGGLPPRGGGRVGSSNRRQRVALVLVGAILVLFAARAVQVQVFQGSALAAEARASRENTLILHAARGDIVDSSGRTLATSVVRYNIVVDQRQVRAFLTRDEEDNITGSGPLAAAELIAPILQVDAHELGAALAGEAGYKKIAENVTPEVRAQIMQLGVNGLTSETTTERIYPGGTTAGSVLGWLRDPEADEQAVGAAGLEAKLDAELQGVDGSRSYERGGGGTVIPGAAQSVVPAQDGKTVHTTLMSDLQFACQAAVDKTVTERGAEWGAVTVIEVGTGRVLALCDSGSIDPNNPTGVGGIHSVNSPYEPGSTGKILTVAAAMNEGLVTPTSSFLVPYRYTPPGSSQTFKDHTEHEDYDLTTAGILAESSNTGTVQIGQLMSDEKRVEYMKLFGWGEPSGIELGGEQSGTNLDPAKWDGRTRYATMFGQGIQVNLLQNTNVIATIANGGVRIPVRLVDGYTDANGTYTPVPASPSVEVVSKETSDQMLLMLEGVTTADGATGGRAAIEGYRVAGKTGTAQIPDANGALNDTVASFVGTVPADDPKIAVGVVIYRPANGFFGGTIAAPVFQDVASFALEQMGVAPTGVQEPLYPLSPTG